MKRTHILIYGRVQGVLFRYNVERVANSLGVFGYVKNLDDDSVEVVAEGDEEKINKLIEYCKKGPLFANVKDIKINFEKLKNNFKNFEIRY